MKTNQITTTQGERTMSNHRTLIAVAIAGIAGSLMTSGAQATIGDILFDSDFNADTIGLEPSQTVGATGILPGPTVTMPHQNTGPGTAGTILVQASSGGLTDQPAVLTLPAANDDGTQLTYADFDAFITAPGDPGVRFEWDLSVASSSATPGQSIITASLDGIAPFNNSRIIWGINGGGSPEVSVAFGTGTGATAFLPFAFNTPMHMMVEVDFEEDTYSVFKDSVVLLDDFSVGSSSIFAVSFQGAFGGVTAAGGGVVAIDNFEASVIPEPSTLFLALAGGIVLLGRKSRIVTNRRHK